MPGAGTAKQSGSQEFDQASTTTFKEASPEEKALLAQFQGLGTDQLQGIRDLIAQAQSGSFLQLTPQDQAQLDQAYNAANLQFETGAKDYADFISGGRGMRMSDTPVSQQALERYGLGKAQIASDKALQGLNLGLQSNTARTGLGLAASQALPGGSVAAFNPLFSERMASGTTRTSGTGSSQGTYQQPLMQTILQGTSAFNQFGQGLGNLASGVGKMKAFFG